MSLTLHAVPRETIALAWPAVAEAIRRATRKKGSQPLDPDYALARVYASFAGLFEFRYKGAHRAWMLVERIEGQDVRLHVWMLSGVGMEHKAEAVRLLDDLARAAGASRTTFATSEKGWIRALRGFFSPSQIVLERRIPA